jgi:hypothetical protein
MLRTTLIGIIIFISTITFTFAQTSVIRFFAYENLILLSAQIEGQEGFLIFDTGAPDLILNKKYFDDKKNFSDDLQARGFNGQIEDIQVRYTDLQIGNSQWNNQRAKVIDLEHLKPSKIFPILGLAGIELFRDFELVLDFKASTIVLFETDRQGNLVGEGNKKIPHDISFPFKLKGHIPYLDITLNNTSLKLGLDTGSAVSLIQPKFRSKLKESLQAAGQIQLLGTDQTIKQTKLWKLEDLNVSMLTFPPLQVAFTNINAFNNMLSGADLDGILGTEFLSQFTTAINLKKKEVHIWMNSGAAALVAR